MANQKKKRKYLSKQQNKTSLKKSAQKFYFCIFFRTKHIRTFARGHAFRYPLKSHVASSSSN